MDPQIPLLARAYQRGVACAPTAAEISDLISWIDREFSRIPCLVRFWDGDITLSECKTEFSRTGILNISTAHNEHPYLSHSQNARFRAIHDWQHILLGADDSFEGEFATWQHNNAPQSIQWILFSEIVMQAAAYFYFGDFQPQKFVKFNIAEIF